MTEKGVRRNVFEKYSPTIENAMDIIWTLLAKIDIRVKFSWVFGIFH